MLFLLPLSLVDFKLQTKLAHSTLKGIDFLDTAVIDEDLIGGALVEEADGDQHISSMTTFELAQVGVGWSIIYFKRSMATGTVKTIKLRLVQSIARNRNIIVIGIISLFRSNQSSAQLCSVSRNHARWWC